MSSNLKDATGSIRSYFAGEWQILRGYTSAQLADRLATEGVTLNPPEGSWARLSILWGDGFEQTMGGEGVGKNEVVGVVKVQVFVRPDNGERELLMLCDDVRDILNRKELTDAGVVRFGAPSAPKPLRDDAWVGRVIDVPFTVEETI